MNGSIINNLGIGGTKTENIDPKESTQNVIIQNQAMVNAQHHQHLPNAMPNMVLTAPQTTAAGTTTNQHQVNRTRTNELIKHI